MNDSSTSSRPRFSRGQLAAAGVVLLALVSFGVYKMQGANTDEGEYIFASVHTGDIEDLVTATGTLEPRDKVDVGAQVSGQIVKINVEVGDTVTADQILAEIDATTAQARVESNRASLEAQRSNLVDRRTTLAKAERDYQRQINLMKEDATTKEALLNAETTRDSARQAIVSLEAQIKQAQASMRVEETNLRYTTIKAPIDGTVVSITAKRGQTINATQQAPTILTIADLSTMTVRTDVSEADVVKLTAGMQAYFTTLGGQSRRWYGTLKRVEPTPKVQNSVVLYSALFDVENESRELMPSMTAQVFFVRAEARNVLVMPMAALTQGQQIARERMMQEGGAGGAGAGRGGPGGNMMARNGDGAGATAGASGAVTGSPAAGAPGAVVNGATPGAAGDAGPAAPAAASGEAAGERGAGQRGNGAGGGNGRGFGNFNGGQAPSPEQMEQFRRMREQRMAQGGGAGGGAGFGAGGGMGGGFRQGGGMGGGQAAPGQPQRRNGIVMVKTATGELEQRQVVVGVSTRTHGEVLEGLMEGEEVVVGRVVEEEAEAAAAAGGAQNQQNNQFRPGGQGVGGGGNFRPF